MRPLEEALAGTLPGPAYYELRFRPDPSLHVPSQQFADRVLPVPATEQREAVASSAASPVPRCGIGFAGQRGDCARFRRTGTHICSVSSPGQIEAPAPKGMSGFLAKISSRSPSSCGHWALRNFWTGTKRAFHAAGRKLSVPTDQFGSRMEAAQSAVHRVELTIA